MEPVLSSTIASSIFLCFLVTSVKAPTAIRLMPESFRNVVSTSPVAEIVTVCSFEVTLISAAVPTWSGGKLASK